jgi:hypothetical protein
MTAGQERETMQFLDTVSIALALIILVKLLVLKERLAVERVRD